MSYTTAENMIKHGRKYNLNDYRGTEHVGTVLEKYKNANSEVVTVFVNSKGFVTEWVLADNEYIDYTGKVKT